MNKYCLKFKKKKIQVALATNNAAFIANELQKIGLLLKEADDLIVSFNNTNISTPIANKKIEKVEPEQIRTISSLTQSPQKTVKKGLPANFAQLLIAKEQEENNVVEKKTSELKNTYLQMQNIIKEKNIKKEIDYIVAAAYCLSHHENIQHFSEKQLQAKIAPFVDEDLDKNFILDAVDKNLIRVLPDFTGFSDTMEFELTDTGEEYFLNVL